MTFDRLKQARGDGRVRGETSTALFGSLDSGHKARPKPSPKSGPRRCLPSRKCADAGNRVTADRNLLFHNARGTKPTRTIATTTASLIGMAFKKDPICP